MRPNPNLIQQRASDFVPKGVQENTILHQRAIQLAKVVIRKEQQQGTSYVCFTLGENECFGVNYQYIEEVIDATKPVKLPATPAFIAGIINRRGVLLTVLDLGKFFNLRATPNDKNSSIIVVCAKDITLGILVNHIVGSNAYDTATLAAPLALTGAIKPEYIVGLHHGDTAIINMTAVLTSPELGISS